MSGSKVAAVAVKRGLAVTVLEAAPRVLARVTAPALSDSSRAEFEIPDRRDGQRFHGKGWPRGVVSRERPILFRRDFVLIGIGLVPNTSLRETGLKVDDGIVVDEASRTSDPDIYAIRRLCDACASRIFAAENPP